MIKFLIAITAVFVILAVVWIVFLWGMSRETKYPGIDDIDLNDPDVKAGR